MKTISLILLSLLGSSILYAQPHLHEWNSGYYEMYSSATFKRLDIVNQKIDPNHIDYPLLNAAIFYRTNEERAHNGRKEFLHSPDLERAAYGHCKDMVKYKFYSHTSPVSGKSSMSDRLHAAGVDYAHAGENIYDFFEKSPTYWELADGLVKGWMKSEGHKKNILNSNFKFLGCGAHHYINTEWRDYFWVKSTQNFSS